MPKYSAEIFITAPVDQVFDALTNPAIIPLWQYNRKLITDWKPGHKITFRTELENKILEQTGTVLEFATNKLIKYNLYTPATNPEVTMEHFVITTYILTPEEGKTKLELIQEDQRTKGFSPVSLKTILVTLKKLIESRGHD